MFKKQKTMKFKDLKNGQRYRAVRWDRSSVDIKIAPEQVRGITVNSKDISESGVIQFKHFVSDDEDVILL